MGPPRTTPLYLVLSSLYKINLPNIYVAGNNFLDEIPTQCRVPNKSPNNAGKSNAVSELLKSNPGTGVDSNKTGAPCNFFLLGTVAVQRECKNKASACRKNGAKTLYRLLTTRNFHIV